MRSQRGLLFFFFNDTATTEIYTLSLHDALPISLGGRMPRGRRRMRRAGGVDRRRRAAAAPRARRDRQGHSCEAQVRLSVHQRAVDAEEARPVPAEPVLRLVGAPR